MATETNEKENSKKENEEKKTLPKDNIVITQHTATIGGKKIKYTVTAGTMVLKEESEKKGDKAGESEGEKPKASIFFIAYTRDDVKNPRTRPISFAFNGGPGSASVWLHLGVLGPKRVQLDEIGNAPPPPNQLVNNEYSLLDQTDLVFIDPVSTGFSRAVVGERAKEFHGFKKDIESVGDFIRLYATRYKRWSSPKFIIGESYGTTRAAGLSGYLQDRHGMYLNGLILVSVILNFQTARFFIGNDLPYSLFLPTYAATAWYHKKLKGNLQKDLKKTLAEVEEFAMNEYTLALMKGEGLAAADRTALIKKIASYTGLSEDYVDRTNLRIQIHRFTKELLRDQRRTVGRLDSRFTGVDRDSAGELSEFDPASANLAGAYTATLNQYVRHDLNFANDLPYEVSAGLWQSWSYSQHENQYANVAETLRKAMSMNPNLKVHATNGFYDLATPYFATQYTFNHMQLDPSLQKNISMSYYEAGHMMYIHIPSLKKMKEEMAKFIKSAMTV